MWCIPHLFEADTTKYQKEGFVESQTAYKGNIIIHLVVRNILTILSKGLTGENDLLPIIGESQNYLIVETSYVNSPMGLYDIIQNKG